MTAMMPVSEALQRLLADAAPLDTEAVPLDRAHGRVLAEDITARRTQPPWPVSAMDGYAARAEDIAQAPCELEVIGSVAAGDMFDGAVRAGQAVRIFTGAPLPPGADAILIQENAEPISDTAIRARESVAKGQFVRPAGLDFSEGDTLLETGRVLDAGALSLAAAGNHASLPVARKPRVGILATGDELVAPGQTPGPSQIIASNSFGVAAIVRDAGADVMDFGIAADNDAALHEKLDQVIEAGCDVLITLGGASVGDHDLIRPVFGARGMALDFYKLAMRPGKPMMFGRLDGLWVLGLPGNPVSSLVCAHIFAAPLIAALAGRPHRSRIQLVKLGAPLPANGPREHYMRAQLSSDGQGNRVAIAFDNQDSSIIRNFAHADALIVRAPDAPAAKEGEMVEVMMLREPL